MTDVFRPALSHFLLVRLNTNGPFFVLTVTITGRKAALVTKYRYRFGHNVRRSGDTVTSFAVLDLLFRHLPSPESLFRSRNLRTGLGALLYGSHVDAFTRSRPDAGQIRALARRRAQHAWRRQAVPEEPLFPDGSDRDGVDPNHRPCRSLFGRRDHGPDCLPARFPVHPA